MLQNVTHCGCSVSVKHADKVSHVTKLSYKECVQFTIYNNCEIEAKGVYIQCQCTEEEISI